MEPVTMVCDRQFAPDTDGRTVRCSFCNQVPEVVGDLIDGPPGPGREPAVAGGLDT